MIAIVEGVTKISVKWMYVIETRKVSENLSKALGNGLLREFDFPHAVDIWLEFRFVSF